MTCPLCLRPLGDVNIDRHHLVPKCKGGKEQEEVHRICHRKVHATLTEKELEATYDTWAKLREQPELAAFVKWVQKKDPGFYSGSDETNTSKKKRRR